MAEIIVMPQQGNSVESVFLLEWKVREGDTCAVGDTLCEVETDKATMEVEATAAGTVLALLAAEGDEVAVKAPLVAVGEPGEDVAALLVGTGVPTTGASTATQPTPAERSGKTGTDDVSPSLGTGASAVPTTAASHHPSGGASGAISPRARMRAGERGVDPTAISGSGPGGRVIERDVLTALVPTTAAARGADASLDGSAIGGRVGAADVARQEAAGASVAAPSGVIGSASLPSKQSYEERAVRGVRKVTAERMLASLTSTAQLTLNASADARALERMRARFKSEGNVLGLERVNINDMVMFAVARTLPRFPALNAHFLGETIREFSRVDLGFAVDTERGLLVPTVSGADTLSLATMSGEIRRLAELCQSGKAGTEELAPATFTVTNLGAFGIESFTPVLNPPQVAILGVSAITLRAERAPDGTVAHIPKIALSLTIDHQAVDGAPAARFLAALTEAIASIDLLTAL